MGVNWQHLYSLIKSEETPLYLFETQEIETRFEALRAALPDRVQILYSLKANPHPSVVQTLRRAGASFDVASLTELETVLSAECSPAEISFVGPGKTEREIRRAISVGVGTLVCESLDQIRLVNLCAHEAGIMQNIALRINPREYVDAKGRRKKDRVIQFGIDEEEIDAAFGLLFDLPAVHVVGIHTHVQSQILDAGVIADNFRITYSIFEEVRRRHAPWLHLINFGGGFGIPVTANDHELDLAALHSELGWLGELDCSLKLAVETGRYLVGPSGRFITRVLYRKESRGKRILIVDGGMNNHFSAVGLNQFERRNYVVHGLTSGPRSGPYTYTIVGPSCYSMDVLASDVELPEMRPGDLLCFESSGCYGLTFSPTRFLGQQTASERFVESLDH